MATMTFQYGGYFAFKLITLLENNAGYPHFFTIALNIVAYYLVAF